MKLLALLGLALIPVGAAAQAPTPVEHAAVIVAQLHDTMLDPTSFVLDGVYVTKPLKTLVKTGWPKTTFEMRPTYCYAFRSRNHMGGYSEGRAAEDPMDHGKLSIMQPDTNTDGFAGYDTCWGAPCKAKNIDRDITADVAAIAPSLYKKTR